MSFASGLLRVLRGHSRIRANQAIRKRRRQLVIEGLERREVFAAFGAGNLALLISASNTANNTTASIVEINTTTAGQSAIQTLPVSGTGANAIRISGSATSTGYVSRSSNGSLLAFTGHNSTTTAPSNANTLNPRAVVAFGPDANYTLPTTYNGTSGQQTRSATTLDGTTWFIADQAGLYTNGSIAASPIGNFRAIRAFGNTVYVGQNSSTPTAIQVSTVSAATGGTITGLAGLANSNTFRDFYIISSGENGSVFDVLYVLSSTSATLGTVAKFSLLKGADNSFGTTDDTWSANGTYTTAFGGFGLAAADNGASSGASLYATTGSGATSANTVRKMTDTAGYNVTINITTANNVTLYTSSSGTTIKGLDFTPVTPDTTPPTISSLSPADDATDAAIGGNLVATFNENIAKGTGNILIKKTSDNSDAFSIDVTSAQVTVSGASLTIDPPSDLDNSTGYYVQIPNTAVKDIAGNFFAGINDSTTWNFTTIAAGDTTPPTVAGLNPADDATNVALAANLVVTFSEDVVKDSGNILVRKTSDDSIVHTIDVASGLVTISGAVVTINPATDFAFNTGYYVEIPATAFKDASNNFFAGISDKNTWNFTTLADTIPPTVVSIDDGDANNFVPPNVALTYTITFSEDIDETTVSGTDFDNEGTAGVTIGTITETSPGVFTVQVTPTSEGTLRLRIPTGAVIKDIAGNDLVVPVSDDDTLTVDGTAPTVNSIVDNVSGNPIFQGQIVTYTLTFSEDIDDTTISAVDFANAGTATVTFGTFTETSPGTVTLRATTTSAGTLRLRLPEASDIRDLAGNRVTVPVDDDTEITVNASTSNLTAGDVAVIGYNTSANNPDSFVIVTLRTLPAGTVFYVNDNEVASDGGTSFTDLAESEASFTVKAGQSIAAGTVISLPWGSGAVDATEYVWSSTSNAGFGNNNEEIYLYSASSITDLTPTAFIYGVAIGTSTSSRASGLALGTTFIQPSGAAARYKTSGATYSGSPHQLRTAIGDTTNNWEGVAPGNASDWTFTVQAPTLSSVTLNTADGFSNPNQRSMITSLVVTFSAPVTLAADAFTIRNIGLFTASDIPLTAGQILVTPNASNDVYTIRFGAGTSVNSRSGSGNRGNSLADGNYRLEIDPTKVTNGGGSLSGKNVFGAAATDRFFRMFGDSNGDGRVDGADFNRLKAAFATNDPIFDFDGDGAVSSATNGVDFSEYQKRHNRRRRIW